MAPIPDDAVPVRDIVDLGVIGGAVAGVIGRTIGGVIGRTIGGVIGRTIGGVIGGVIGVVGDRTVSDRMVDLAVLVGDGVITWAIFVRNRGQWHHDEHCQREQDGGDSVGWAHLYSW